MENQAEAPKIEKLPMSITVKLNGEDKEVFMSFALLNQLSILTGDAEQVPLIHMNPAMRQAILEQMLAERSKGGRITKPVEIDDCEISLDDVNFLLDFAAAHILDFMLGAVEKATALSQRNLPRLESLKSTLTGQENLPLKKLPA